MNITLTKNTLMKKIYVYMQMLVVAMMAMTVFTSCEEDDQYLASTLRNRDWQGYIGAYYQDRWGISGSEYATVMRFSSKDEWYTSGRGVELDYNTRSPHSDYAYCTFKWFIVDGEITLIYDDSKWNPIYIIDYALSSTYFRGYIYDGSNRRIKFSLENSSYGDWDYYGGYTSGSKHYGDFSNQNFYWSRQATSFDDADGQPASDVLILDRTEEARQYSGEADAVSIASGIFAEKMKNME